jgi:hypothetical protein
MLSIPPNGDMTPQPRNGSVRSRIPEANRAARLEDPEWRELEDHSFEVFSRGKWNKIPPNKVLKGTNKVGYAILWWPKAWDNPTCFLPGPEN